MRVSERVYVFWALRTYKRRSTGNQPLQLGLPYAHILRCCNRDRCCESAFLGTGPGAWSRGKMFWIFVLRNGISRILTTLLSKIFKRFHNIFLIAHSIIFSLSYAVALYVNYLFTEFQRNSGKKTCKNLTFMLTGSHDFESTKSFKIAIHACVATPYLVTSPPLKLLQGATLTDVQETVSVSD